MEKIKITFLGDVLCVWAYATHTLITRLKEEYGDRIVIDYRFISVFGDAKNFIEKGWHNKGSFSGFSEHLQEVCNNLGYINATPAIWKDCMPKTSSMAHWYLKAIQLWEAENNSLSNATSAQNLISEDMLWQMRMLFFQQGRDISNIHVLNSLFENTNIPFSQITPYLEDGSAMAALLADYELETKLKLDGSPTLLLNSNRQKLYGNTGYEVIKANIEALI